MKLIYTYSTPSIKNNGNVLTQTITAPKTAGGNLVITQSYGYDGANRLSSAEESTSGVVWKQGFTYDRFGNRTFNTAQTFPSDVLSSSIAISATTNRITSPNHSYDNVGNLTAEPGKAYVYDGENRLTSIVGVSSYVYDGDGRRVKKTASNVTTVMVYNAQGQLAAEYGGQAISQAATNYLTTDHLGSTRVVTDQNKAVKARYDYLPFGEEVVTSLSGRSGVTSYSNTDKTRQKFTSKERDNESGLDYFLARYHSNKQGRFTSVDPENAGASPDDPQSWNGYAYARNNPLIYVDSTGRYYDIYDSRGNLTGRVTNIEELDRGYKFVRSENGGRLLHFEGGYTAKFYEDANKGTPLTVSAEFSDLSPTANGVIKELDRNAAPSLMSIYIFGAVNLAPGVIKSGTRNQAAA